MSKDRALTCDMAAKLVGYHPASIRRLCRQGKIKCERLGTNWIMTESAVRKALKPVTEATKES